MCFSAQASFAAAGALSIISLLSIKQAHQKKIVPLALTPLFFGIQQACEGVVWITLNNGDTTSLLHLAATYAFLFFAGVFWPTWVPLSLYWTEQSHKRKQMLSTCIVFGIIVSVIFFYSWLLQTTGATIAHHHIDYPVNNYPFGITHPRWSKILTYTLSGCYGLVTIVPFFISSIPHMKLLGIIIGMSALISYIFYITAFASVWCFFAAVCSIFLILVVRNYDPSIRF
jgi:hypothetical protein